MEKMLEFLVKTIVDDQQAVKVCKEESDSSINFVVTVADGDLGKVIGKGGKTAVSIRTIMKSACSKQHKKVFVKFESEQ